MAEEPTTPDVPEPEESDPAETELGAVEDLEELASDDGVVGAEGRAEPDAGEGGEAADAAGTALDDDAVAVARRERDEYLEALRRLQADFENFRKQTMKRQTEQVERAAESLVDKLLPVLDACDSALVHGGDDVKPIFGALLGTLEKEGLERIDPEGQPFDPTRHEAVMHEEGDEEDPVVVEVMRMGYVWKGRLLRPAMVKVRG